MSELRTQWKAEYEAPFSGWDFSHLKGRLLDENPPWDYKEMARQLLQQSETVLDMGTGGGEFLASLAPLPKYTVATELREPTISIARERLEPLGVKVVGVSEEDDTPFEDKEFNAVLNRHASFKPAEIYRILKPGGTFLTQQVGGDNLCDLSEEFDATLPYRELTFDYWEGEIRNSGLMPVKSEEWRGKMEFMDVGAIAYFIKAISYQVSDFDIDRDMHYLEKLHHKLERGERLAYTQIRYLFEAVKPDK
ncbi:MAG: class I SAM-dependent methyltransferase [Dehalococcoidia bacterium]|jgi:SAM-dependent methyltransferase